VLRDPSPVPAAHGLYAWYFRDLPPSVPTDNCLTVDGKTLLYIGIAPDKQSNPKSSASLLSRIRYHYVGNAEGSTLRRTLGVFLENKSGLPLRRVGSGKRFTLTHAGEQYLDEWMRENTFVAWIAHPEPWLIERVVLGEVSCPLNITHNKHHPFVVTLRQMRKEALRRAREMPIANEHNQKR
jgi:GIY-YIG catalytic domain